MDVVVPLWRMSSKEKRPRFGAVVLAIGGGGENRTLPNLRATVRLKPLMFARAPLYAPLGARLTGELGPASAKVLRTRLSTGQQRLRGLDCVEFNHSQAPNPSDKLETTHCRRQISRWTSPGTIGIPAL